MGDLNPLPWVFMMGNCYGWVFYSFLIGNYYVFFANAPGLVVSVWLNLQAVKLRYLAHHEKFLQEALASALSDEDSRAALLSGTRKVPIDEITPPTITTGVSPPTATRSSPPASWEVVVAKKHQQPPPIEHDIWSLGMILTWLAITSLVAFGQALEKNTQELIVGISVNINLVSFLGAPLSTIWTVLRTRSSSSIHVPTMLTNTANSVFWSAYGIAIQDWFIAVPNSLGVILGVVQILLRLVFPVKLAVIHDNSITENGAQNTVVAIKDGRGDYTEP